MGRKNNFASPTKSPSKTAKARKANASPIKLKDTLSLEKKESGLVSPTSISMQNSFIIKNADESFDAYYAQMRKRKLGSHGGHMLENMHTMGGQSATQASPGQKDSHFGVVYGIQPAARDGH